MAIELEVQTRRKPVAGGSDGRARARSIFGDRISNRERMFFTERLALLLETGGALHGSLQLLSGQCENPALSKVAAALAEDIAGGMPFARALAKHPEAFPTVFVNLVDAGERGGFLSTVLAELTALEEKTARLRATLVSAFTYPAFLIVFSLAVVIFVLVYVFPKFADLFSAIRDQLPFSTLMLMTASDLLRQQWPVLFGGFVVSGVGFRHWLRDAGGAVVIDRLKLRIPVLRDIFAQLYLVQTMRVMGLSLENGVSVPDALRASRDLVHNKVFRDFVRDVEHDVNEGRGISGAFERAPFMPELARQLIETGEETGSLALVMNRMAGHYERELSRRLESLAKLIEPMLLLLMGAVVGIIVASLILPIFKLSRAVGV